MKVTGKAESACAFGNGQEFSGEVLVQISTLHDSQRLKLSFPLTGGVLPPLRATALFRHGAACLLFCDQFLTGLGSILIWKKKKEKKEKKGEKEKEMNFVVV